MSQATANRGRRGSPKSIRPSSFRWMVGIVLVPLVILGVLAGMGIRAQKAAARAGVREEAESLATAQARLISEQLKSSILPIPSFPDPPIPGPSSPKETILNGEDLLALAALRDDPKAGNSPAGLPRRALAGLRILHLDPTTQDPSELVTLLTDEAPSILSSRGLEQVRRHFPKTTVPLPWQHLSRLRELLAIHPNGGWIAEDGEIWWISENGERLLPPTALTALNLELAPYATAQFSTPNGTLGPPLSGDVLARIPLDFPSLITLEWILTSPELIAGSTRLQTLWTVALLGTSLIASALGFFALLRAFSRERRLGQLKSQFVASVSHELRAPIGSIRLMADTLEEERTDDPKELHQLIARESTRLSHLIENVLDFARIEEGRRTYHFEECNLASLVRDTLDLFTHRAAETEHLLEPELPDCRTSVDPSALQQALINLLDNALKFSPPGSTIAITIASTADGWSIAVTSEGEPIPAAERSRIFDRFYRLGDDRVTGLESGADDYLTKPFSLRELLARVQALLRRVERNEAIPDPYPLGAATIHFSKRELHRGSEIHELTEKEVGMLRLLISAQGEPVTREHFLNVVWGYQAFPSTRTIDNFVLALRKKLEADPAHPQHLLTVRARGYRLAS